MKAFADLFTALDETNKTNEKIDAIRSYLEKASPEDSAWAISFLTGRKPKQIVPTRKLRDWAIEEAQIPEWLFDESYEAVGDLGETITLLLPKPVSQVLGSLKYYVEEILMPMRNMQEADQKKALLNVWRSMNYSQRFVWNKLITGSFRIGVSQQLVVKAIARLSGIKENVIAHRLMGAWQPDKEFYNSLIAENTEDADVSRPYPFYLSYQLDSPLEKLGDPSEWLLEWKWDGIRSQIIKRNNEIFIWSRGEDLITERFPDLKELAVNIPEGTVLDGEILPFKNGLPMPFSELQKRIGRKNLTKKILEEIPASYIAFDLLEFEGKDIRLEPLSLRRSKLKDIISELNKNSVSSPLYRKDAADLPDSSQFIYSPEIKISFWSELSSIREESRERQVEGIFLKKLNSVYETGRKRGNWWKWKIDPFTVDAVLIYAQRGHGRRASLYTDYTFGVWDDNKLIPFAKAYSGLTDEEIKKVDNFVRHNTVEKFGPVRTVKQELVFELAFEGIQLSPRHKSGIAVRFPRILKWRTDKKIEDADSLVNVKALLKA